MKKKFNIISIIILFITVFLFIFSCDDSLMLEVEPTLSVEDDSTSLVEDDLNNLITANDYDSIRRNLLEYSILSNYERSYSDEREEVRVLISSFNEDSLDHDFTVVKNPESIDVLPEHNIRVDIFDITDNTNGKTCFVLIPNDVRFGSVFFISDNGHWDDSINEDDPDSNLNIKESFCEIIIGSFTERAKKIYEIWETITEEEIEAERKKYLGTTRDYTVDSLKVVTSPYEEIGSNIMLCTKNWGQGSFYNDAIEKAYGAGKRAGCTTIAVATVAAYFEWPKYFVEYTENGRKATKSQLKLMWFDFREWDGKFDWENMNKGYKKEQIAALIFDVAELIEAEYGWKATAGNDVGIYRALTKLGFKFKYDSKGITLDYDRVSRITSSIKNGRPVIAGGPSRDGSSAHEFIIDGAMAKANTIYYKQYVIGPKVTVKEIVKHYTRDVFYHVGFGWNGDEDGWYSGNYLGDDGFQIESMFYDIHI